MRPEALDFFRKCIMVTISLLICSVLLLLYSKHVSFPNIFYLHTLALDMCSVGAVVLLEALIGSAIVWDKSR